ncbi:MAG: hypothetical protein HY961_13750 [Ignavibacteriae bacterium]|nr:hypothetical protein [Ignavibacteriota bacterium]
MKRLLKIAAGGVGLIALLAVGVLYYHGAFLDLTVDEKSAGPFHFIYKEMKGTNMSQVGVITNELNDLLSKRSFATQRPFDLFFPDGHAEIGFVIDQREFATLDAADTSFSTRIIAQQRFMTTTFPWKNVMSYMVGFMKVDPLLSEHRKKHGYRKTWAATLHQGDIITYFQPIEPELIAPH